MVFVKFVRFSLTPANSPRITRSRARAEHTLARVFSMSWHAKACAARQVEAEVPDIVSQIPTSHFLTMTSSSMLFARIMVMTEA